MIRRCYNQADTSYANYGGRGIAVCQEWLGENGFVAFLACLGTVPARGLTIDRKDVNGNYEPGNVHWATPKEQARNRRSNRIIAFAGKEMCLVEWAAHTGLLRETIARRLRRGWSTEMALTTPVKTGE